MSRKLIKRIGLWTGGLLLGTSLLALGGAGWFVTRSLPDQSGHKVVRGVTAKVDLVRDANGIPHIFAASRTDALFALGYAQAQDRLWQLAVLRRVSQGRLAELVGSGGLATDKLVRLFDPVAMRDDGMARLTAEQHQMLDAYAAGINAAVTAMQGRLPPEFTLLGADFEPWQAADSVGLSSLGVLAARNWRNELLRAGLPAALDAAKLATLFPNLAGIATHAPAPGTPPTPVLSPVPSPVRPPQAAMPGLAPDRGFASNGWVLNGARTRNGRALLASDTHGPFGMPADYYLARLVWPGADLRGASFPGMPVFVLGGNGAIAWGVTDVGADTADLFVERLSPGDPGSYDSPDGPQALQHREESIAVKGATPVTQIFRNSRHGPVVSDILPEAAAVAGDGRVMALALAMHQSPNTTIGALLDMNVAADWDGFQAALTGYRMDHNFTFADRAGHVGMLSAMTLPVRRGGDGFLPVPGWDGAADWLDLRPASASPRSLDPVGGVLLNANNRPLPQGLGPFVGREFELPYRARRLQDLLAGLNGADITAVAAVQQDVVSLEVQDLLPALLVALPADLRTDPAVALLAGWDGSMAADRPQPLIFAAWRRELLYRLFGAALGPTLSGLGAQLTPALLSALAGNGGWCPATGCGVAVGGALRDALAGLRAHYGADPARWRWGTAHPARFSMQGIGDLPLVGPLVNAQVETAGGDHTVNTGRTGDLAATRTADLFLNDFGPRYRQIIDMADPASSLFMLTPGVSGHPASPWRGHLAAGWAAGRYVTLSGTEAEVAAGGVGTLTLLPQ